MECVGVWDQTNDRTPRLEQYLIIGVDVLFLSNLWFWINLVSFFSIPFFNKFSLYFHDTFRGVFKTQSNLYDGPLTYKE